MCIRDRIINALGKGIYPPENLSDCDDTQVMIKALSEGKETIDIMAAGTAMRFLTAYLSVTPGERTITGTARMQQRPIQTVSYTHLYSRNGSRVSHSLLMAMNTIVRSGQTYSHTVLVQQCLSAVSYTHLDWCAFLVS